MFTTVSFLITICTKYTERSGNVSDTIGKSYRTSQNEEQLCRSEGSCQVIVRKWKIFHLLHQRVSLFSVLPRDSSHVCLLVLVVAFA